VIISHKYRFIFIKTSKTASTSIEIALSRFCGRDDIITRNSPDDEIIRQHLGYPGPQNHYLQFSEYSAKDWLNLLLRGKRKRLTSHLGASRIKQFVGNEIWNSYYKFCFERNPWDRTVSLYYHFLQDKKLNKMPGNESISAFIESGYPLRLKKRGIELYSINNEIVVDRVCLFENLENELQTVCNDILGMPEKISLPRAKGNHRKDLRHYRQILNPSDTETLKKIFSREIDLFNYRF